MLFNYLFKLYNNYYNINSKDNYSKYNLTHTYNNNLYLKLYFQYLELNFKYHKRIHLMDKIKVMISKQHLFSH